MSGDVSTRSWNPSVIRWAVFIVVAALAMWLAGPMTVQVGQNNGRPIFEPYPSVVLIRTAAVLIAVGMLGYDLYRRVTRH